MGVSRQTRKYIKGFMMTKTLKSADLAHVLNFVGEFSTKSKHSVCCSSKSQSN